MTGMTQYLRNEAFNPQDVATLGQALDAVCNALKVDERDEIAREVIAIRLIELAHRGERDPELLRERVLKEASGGADLV
jgi:hypothetical protein